jgi:hypothetical protein
VIFVFPYVFFVVNLLFHLEMRFEEPERFIQIARDLSEDIRCVDVTRLIRLLNGFAAGGGKRCVSLCQGFNALHAA